MKIYFDGAKRVNAEVNGFTIYTDQSAIAGGEGRAPEPFTLFLASMGTCAGIYVKTFCDKREISSAGISLEQSITYNRERKMIEVVHLEIIVPETFPKKYHDALMQTASLCAVKKHVHPDIVFDIKVKVETE